MAYYLNKLENGDPLPVYGKVAFLLANIAGSFIVRVDDPAIPGIIDPPYQLPISTFEEMADLVCVAELPGYDVVCCIDIPRQLELCRQGWENCRKTWMVVPGGHKLAGVPKRSTLTEMQQANLQIRYAWPVLLFLSLVAWPIVHNYFDRYPGCWALWGLIVGYLYKYTKDAYRYIKNK